MPFKPRRTKSLQSLQHSSNIQSPWADNSEAKEDLHTGKDSKRSRASEVVLFTLPNKISVRQFRRSDAKAVYKLFDQPDVPLYFTDTYVPENFSLWKAHKLIDESLDQDKSWRPQYLSSDVNQSTYSSDLLYERAVHALTQANLDERLNNKPYVHDQKSCFLCRSLKHVPMLPIAYAIVNEDDLVIGMVDLEFQNLQIADSESLEDSCEPAFLHDAEISYVLLQEYRNLGIATLVVREFLTWAWHNFAQLERISAAVYATWNSPSCKVLQKNNFFLEATLKKGVRKRGRWGNLEIYGIFRPGSKMKPISDSDIA